MHRATACFVILVLAACRGKPSGGDAQIDTTRFASLAPAAPLDSTLRVVVTEEPQVYANGHPVTLAALDTMLAALKRIEGDVWFFRPQPDIRLAARQNALIDSVFALVRQHELVLRPSRAADFGDLIGKRRPSAGAEEP